MDEYKCVCSIGPCTCKVTEGRRPIMCLLEEDTYASWKRVE